MGSIHHGVRGVWSTKIPRSVQIEEYISGVEVTHTSSMSTYKGCVCTRTT